MIKPDAKPEKHRGLPHIATSCTTVLHSGKKAAGIRIPPEIVEGLGAGRVPPVGVTVNDYIYRSTVAVMGGAYMGQLQLRPPCCLWHQQWR